MTIKLTYIHHSCFVIENNDVAIVIDYFKDVSLGVNRDYVHKLIASSTKDIYILVTHSHPDHYSKEIFELGEDKKNVIYIISDEVKDILPSDTKHNPILLSKFQTYIDDQITVKAFGSTDIGGSFLINFAERVIYHAGDLNNWHWREEVPEEEAKGYEDAYLAELKLLKEDIKTLDLTLFPIDKRLGKDYMLGAMQFIDEIKTDYFTPMHFQGDYASANLFSEYASKKGVHFLGWNNEGESYQI